MLVAGLLVLRRASRKVKNCQEEIADLNEQVHAQKMELLEAGQKLTNLSNKHSLLEEDYGASQAEIVKLSGDLKRAIKSSSESKSETAEAEDQAREAIREEHDAKVKLDSVTGELTAMRANLNRVLEDFSDDTESYMERFRGIIGQKTLNQLIKEDRDGEAA